MQAEGAGLVRRGGDDAATGIVAKRGERAHGFARDGIRSTIVG